MAQTNLSPQAKKVLELVLAGRADDAEQYIDGEYSKRITQLEQDLQAAQQEKNLLMTAVGLARRGAAQPQQAPRIRSRSRTLSKDDRRQIVLRSAMDVAKLRDGLVAVQAVVDELVAKGVNLGMDKPNTSVGNLLHKSDEWKREGRGLFRYVGKQLDLGRAK